MPGKKIRDDLYGAMYAAIAENAGYVYRGRDKQPGPQVGRGTFTQLKRWGWVDLVRVKVVKGGQVHHETAGGWLTGPGRAALRAEILRRGDTMPARLSRPARPRPAAPDRPAAPAAPAPAPTPRRPAAPARPTIPAPTRPSRTGTALLERPAPSVTALVDAFALIGTAGGRDGDDIPF